MKKPYLILLFLILFFSLGITPAYAWIHSGGGSGGGSGGNTSKDPLGIVPVSPNSDSPKCSEIYIPSNFLEASGRQIPQISQLVCPFLRLLNVMMVLVGVGFVIMALFGAWKYSLSQGDPKGIEGAKATLTYSIIGLLVVAGVFLILNIIQNAFSLESGSVLSPFGWLQRGIEALETF